MSAKYLMCLTACVFMAIGLVSQAADTHRDQDPQPKNPARSLPPDIKPGVKVRFSVVSGGVFPSANSVDVVKISGSWVFVEGGLRVQSDKQADGWINFDNVVWYKVVGEKK